MLQVLLKLSQENQPAQPGASVIQSVFQNKLLQQSSYQNRQAADI